MSISEHAPAAGPAQVLGELLGVVRGLDETLWAARSEEELVDTVGLVAQLTGALAAVEAGAVAEVEARDLARRRLQYGSTGDWLTHLGGLRRGEGKQRVARAKALTGPLTRTREALVAGSVSPGQADLVVAAVDDLPPGEWVRRRGEKVMLAHAARLDASELATVGRRLVEVVDPDAVDRRLEAALEREERAAHHGRFLTIGQDRAGGSGSRAAAPPRTAPSSKPPSSP
jgi:ABC-type Na+ efflux pump permease subunit